MAILRTKTRLYYTEGGSRRVKVWKIGPFVVWRRSYREGWAR